MNKGINQMYLLLAEMYNRQEQIKEVLGINLVTCGQCGAILLAKDDDFVDKEDMIETGHRCPCGFFSDVSDFPDFFLPPE